MGGLMKKLIFLCLLLSASVNAQSTYSSADQDTEQNKEGTHLDTGYSNKDVEKEEMDFSDEEPPRLPTKHPTPEEQQDNSFPETENDLNY